MKFVLIVSAIALTLSSVAAAPKRQDDDSAKLTAYFLKHFEALRPIMKTGSPDLGIPILDPFENPKEEIKFDDQIYPMGYAKGNVTPTETKVEGLSTFVIREFEVTKKAYSADFYIKLDVPDYLCSGKFSTKGLWGFPSYIPPIPIRINGNGEYTIRSNGDAITSPITIQGSLYQPEGETLKFSKFAITSMYVGWGREITVTGLLNKEYPRFMTHAIQNSEYKALDVHLKAYMTEAVKGKSWDDLLG
jgi:hypothetical protein